MKREYNRYRFLPQCLEIPFRMRAYFYGHGFECGADYQPVIDRNDDGSVRHWRLFFPQPIYFHVQSFSKVENVQNHSHEKTLFVTKIETNDLTIHNPVGWEDMSITVEKGKVLENYSHNRQDSKVFIKYGFLSDRQTELTLGQQFQLGDWGAKGKLGWHEVKPDSWVKQFFQDINSGTWTCKEGFRTYPCEPNYD